MYFSGALWLSRLVQLGLFGLELGSPLVGVLPLLLDNLGVLLSCSQNTQHSTQNKTQKHSRNATTIANTNLALQKQAFNTWFPISLYIRF